MEDPCERRGDHTEGPLTGIGAIKAKDATKGRNTVQEKGKRTIGTGRGDAGRRRKEMRPECAALGEVETEAISGSERAETIKGREG